MGKREKVHDFNVNYWQSGEIEKVGYKYFKISGIYF